MGPPVAVAVRVLAEAAPSTRLVKAVEAGAEEEEEVVAVLIEAGIAEAVTAAFFVEAVTAAAEVEGHLPKSIREPSRLQPAIALSQKVQRVCD